MCENKVKSRSTIHIALQKIGPNAPNFVDHNVDGIVLLVAHPRLDALDLGSGDRGQRQEQQ